MADKILFKSGLASKLNEITKIAGQLLFAIDGTSGSIYLDKDSTTRIKMNLDATKLQNARTINGTAFDGTQNITTTKWGNSRTLTLGTDSSGSVSIDGSTNVTLNVTNNKVKGYEFFGGTCPYVWYKSAVTYTNTTTPTDVWYVKITLNATYICDFTPIYITADYSNCMGRLLLNLDSFGSGWSGYLTTYNGSNIQAIRRAQNSSTHKTEIYVKLAKPVAYNGSTSPGYIKVYSPYEVESIAVCTAEDAGSLIALINGYNSNTPIKTTGQIYSNASTADKWKTARSFTISNKAGAGTAISVDGSQSSYTLTIPNTITNFVSIGTKDLTASGTITANKFSGSLTGNADTATKWKSPITIKIGNTSKTIQGGETTTIEYTHNNVGATISKFTWTDGNTSGPTLKLSVNGSTDSSAMIPSASTTVSGVVTTGNQNFAGKKTFTGGVQVNTSTDTYPLSISRSGSANEITNIYQDNNGLIFDINNDEKIAYAQFNFNATDTENSDGSDAQTGSILLGLDDSKKSYVQAQVFKGSLSGNANTATEFNSSRAIALTGNVTGTATSTGKSGWSIATTIANGAVTNGMLKNSSINIAGNSVSLGGSLAASTIISSLGLSSAMRFIGIATVPITDGSTTNPVIDGYDFANNKKPGDVVIDKDNSYEYVWSSVGKWERLGPDGSYKTVQTAVADPAASGNSSSYIKSITQNSNGVITVSKASIANLAIKLNGGTTEGTNLFTFNGSAGKTVDITPESIGATIIPFIAGTQTAATGTWTGSTNEISALEDGQTIRYWLPYNGNGNATLNLTLKDGSSTGAIPCYRSGTSRLTTQFGAGNVIVLTYRKNVPINGSSTTYTGWWVDADYNSDTISRLRYDNARVMAGTNGIYGYSLIALDNNNRWQGFVKSRTTGTTKTINTEAKFRLPINILYYDAGNNATNGNYVPNTYAVYSAYPSIDLRYSHNYTTNFTVNTPVYLEGTIDSDGYFSVSTTCITQTFTSGKYYIFLGTSNNGNAYQLALHTSHPIYYYDGTKLVNYVKKLYANDLTINGKTYNGTSNVDVGTLGIGYGGTGITSNPSMLVNLGSGTAANIFTASPRPGVTGVLGVGNGGTGKTNAKDACNYFINSLDMGSGVPADDDYYISQYVNGGATTTTYHRRPMSTIYSYIKGKAEGTWNISISGSCGGNAATADKFSSNKAITLSGAVTGTYSSDGSSGWSIPTEIAGATIDGSFSTQYRTQIKGDAQRGNFLKVIRNNTASVANSPQFGSGLGWGREDTHGYLYVSYSSAAAYIGGGNQNSLSWVKKIAFADGTGATGSWGINITGSSASCTGNAKTADSFSSNRAIALTGDVTGTASSNGSSGWSISTTYNTIVPVGKGGTGNNIGCAPMAKKLVDSANNNLAVGSETEPIYFSEGVPKKCTSISLNSSSASKWAKKMTLKLSGAATNTNPSTVSFDGSEGDSGVTLSMPSQISGFTSVGTSKLTITSTALEGHIIFSRAGWNYIKAPTGGSIAFVPNGRDISGTGAVLTISDAEVIPGNNNNTINLGTSSYKWKNVYATTFNGALSGNATSATSLSDNVIIGVSCVAGINNSVSFKTSGTYTYSLPQTVTNFTKLESDIFVVNDKVTLQYNATSECLEFVFV